MGDETLPIWATGSCSIFYADDIRTGGGGVIVAGAEADDAADTTGATLEGATDVGAVVTAAGVMMEPAGIESP